MNRSNSAVLYAGAWAGRTNVLGGFSLCRDGLKILGIVYWRNGGAQKNWDGALRNVQARAACWGKRDLSLSGRVLAANLYLQASLNHLACVYPVPFVMGRRLECAVFTFIWGGRTEQVARMRMYTDRKRSTVCPPSGPWQYTWLSTRGWSRGRRTMSPACSRGSGWALPCGCRSHGEGHCRGRRIAWGITRRQPSSLGTSPGVRWTTGSSTRGGGTAVKHTLAWTFPACQQLIGCLCSLCGCMGPARICIGWELWEVSR